MELATNLRDRVWACRKTETGRKSALPASLVLGEEEEDGEALVAGVRPHKAGCSSSAPLNSSQQPKHSTQLRTSLHIGSTHINPLHTVLVNFTLHIF